MASPLNWLARWWRSLLEADPVPNVVDVKREPDALLQAMRPELDVEKIADNLEQAKARLNRRLLLRQAAAFAVSVGAVAREGLRDVSIPSDFFPGEIDEWARTGSDPLRDIMEARSKIWQSVGLQPSLLILGSGHRAYMRARFGLDLADPAVREELGQELGLRVELAAAT